MSMNSCCVVVLVSSMFGMVLWFSTLPVELVMLIVRFTVKVAFFGLASLIVRLNSTSVGSIPVVFIALMWGIMSWISIVWL